METANTSVNADINRPLAFVSILSQLSAKLRTPASIISGVTSIEEALDEETFEALARLEGRVEALRLAYLSLVIILTYRDRTLEKEIETGLFGSFVDTSDKNPHLAMQEELSSLLNEITALRERRDEPKAD